MVWVVLDLVWVVCCGFWDYFWVACLWFPGRGFWGWAVLSGFGVGFVDCVLVCGVGLAILCGLVQYMFPVDP